VKVLIIGSGGREHTLAWKISQSPKLTKLYCAPGNAGTAIVAENVPIADNDIAGLKDFAVKNSIDLTIVGPEIPLVMGIVDEFEAAGLKIFGPSKAAAKIEGSKIFAKNLMHKYNIPTAEAIVYEKVEDALNFVKKVGTPIVIKVDGLAAGKGVFVAKDQKEAEEAVKRILVDKEFGAAGNKIIVEECLKGEEVSILAITDGETILPLASAQDHKRVFDRDEGPNTGGMGAYSPAPIATSELLNMVQEKVLKKTVAALKEAGIIYKGILYCGLMMTASGPMVLEFNCRFGDPETQVILPRMKNDLLEVILSTLDSRLSTIALDWDPRSAVCVVLAAGGYPGNYEKGIEIKGLDNVKDGVVFHAGTKAVDVKITTNGGRVLGVVGLGAPLKEAIRKAYDAVKQINFDKMHFRKDIGAKALK